MAYLIDFRVVWDNAAALLSGLFLGLALAFFAVLIGSVIGLCGALLASSRSRALQLVVAGYVTAIRNMPILVIVLIVYFALPDLGVRMGKLESFIASLSVYAGAYLTEVFRAGLGGVAPGVVDAGYAVGLNRLQVAWLIRLPLMVRNILPALGSTFISLFKDTSIAAAIAVPELTYQARKINVETFRVIEAWTAATFLYVATCLLLAVALRQLEKRYQKF